MSRLPPHHSIAVHYELTNNMTQSSAVAAATGKSSKNNGQGLQNKYTMNEEDLSISEEDDKEEQDSDSSEDQVLLYHLDPTRPLRKKAAAANNRRFDTEIDSQGRREGVVSDLVIFLKSLGRGVSNSRLGSSSSSSGVSGVRDFSSDSNPKLGTKRGLLMALGLGVVLMVMVISTAVLVSNSKASSFSDEEGLNMIGQFKNETVTLEDVLSSRFSAAGFNGSWIQGNRIQYNSRGGDIVSFDPSNGEVSVIVSAEDLNSSPGGRPIQVTISPDNRYALMATNYKKLYRYSMIADYDLYNFETKHFEPIVPPGSDGTDRGLQLAQWSSVGNAFAFVWGNNVYYRASAESGASTEQITTDGSIGPEIIYNGVTDWVYEEEMFAGYSAIWFSPDGLKMAYAQFNDTEVDVMQWPIYELPGSPTPLQYPFLQGLAYPKAGRPNPIVSVFHVVLPTVKTKASFVKPVMIDRQIAINYYLGTVFWANDNDLGLVTINRAQNDEKIHICNSQVTCTVISGEIETKGWIDMVTPLPSEDGQEFITITSQLQNRDHYKHIVRFDRNNNRKAITAGNYAVDSILGWDHAAGLIYYTGTRHFGGSQVGDARQAHLYRIQDSGEAPLNPECLTCSIKNSYGKDCLSNSVTLSKEYAYFSINCAGPDIPETTIRSTSNPNVPIMHWSDNKELRNRLELVALPIAIHYTIPLDGGFTARAKVLVPHDYDPNGKYPILVDVYGGPGSQKITQRFGVDWGTSLVSSHNIIYASFDGRGSGRASDDQLFQIYRNLGTLEIEDQITGLKWLLANMPSIDPERTAIWGWSYGGFASAMVMGNEDTTYKCGISVAPVTNWIFYDTIYTERYMGEPTPEDNFAGYNATDVSNLVENFRGKKFMLVHGNADDNVHYQQSMVLAKALERADIMFRQQSYPDQDHGIAQTRSHLYHSLQWFLFDDCFHMSDPIINTIQ